MSAYRRYYQKGGYYFFTLVTYKRHPLFSNTSNINKFKLSFRKVKEKYPFTLNAIVILPDHLHCLWRLPSEDNDYSKRWRLIKTCFSREIDVPTNHRKEKLVWQRRFWEHAIHNETDWRRHLDYIHYNPVKHGLALSPKDWEHSSFHDWVARGAYDITWGNGEDILFNDIHQAE